MYIIEDICIFIKVIKNSFIMETILIKRGSTNYKEMLHTNLRAWQEVVKSNILFALELSLDFGGAASKYCTYKWVYKRKKDLNRKVETYKTRVLPPYWQKYD